MSPDTAAPVTPPKAPSAWRMYRALVGVGLLCGALIVGVFEFTKPIIAENRAEALQAAIFDVVPSAASSKTFQLSEGGELSEVAEGTAGDRVVYAGYDADGRFVGLAIQAAGMGYQDIITVLYGYSPGDDAIVGIQVLDSRETPGLGDKIEKDPAFLRNFEKLDVSLAADGQSMAHPIQAVKSGEKQSPWEVDAITGATISSVAIADILRESSTFWVPRIKPRAGDFGG